MVLSCLESDISLLGNVVEFPMLRLRNGGGLHLPPCFSLATDLGTCLNKPSLSPPWGCHMRTDVNEVKMWMCWWSFCFLKEIGRWHGGLWKREGFKPLLVFYVCQIGCVFLQPAVLINLKKKYHFNRELWIGYNEASFGNSLYVTPLYFCKYLNWGSYKESGDFQF